MGDRSLLNAFTFTQRGPHPAEHLQKHTRLIPQLPKTLHQVRNEIEQAKRTVMNFDKLGSSIPQNFDWVDLNMTSPVKNQGSCGSCYAFASMGMFEARARVQTNGAWQPLFSEQDVVSCTNLAQGCSGGFPYLISKYGQDFGIVEDECYGEYMSGTTRQDEDCIANSCFRHKVSDYGYVGEFYGGATEYAMRQEIYANGPIAVSLEAGGLHDYNGGVWIQPSNGVGWDPYEATTHVVVITGWGWDDETGFPFWNVKNSWGASWGENGYFRII